MSRHVMASFGLLAATAAAALVAAPAAAAVDLLSHRAAYRVSLARSDGVGGLESARGALVVEWRADCSGWLSQQRLGFVGQPSEGPEFYYDVRFSSWEAPDYTRLRFQTRAFEDGKESEAFSGSAALEGRGGRGEARYAEPEEQRIDLPAGTLFPTQHVVRLVEAATAGERIVDHYVFDGSGADALKKVAAVIGEPEAAAGEGGGAGERRWPVRLAYYGAGEADGLPEFQLSFDLGERGVIDDVVLDYGDFALKGELEKLEPLPEPSCE